MKQPTKQRDYLFDNYKALLILLVVIGHFIEPCAGNTEFFRTVKWLIVSFHMPAFIFISGYFSKKELPFPVILRKLAVPYLAYEIIYYLFYTFVIHKETGLYLLYPKFSLWYLLALFVWRTATPYVKRIPHYMLFTIVSGLLIGCSDMTDNFLSLPRILYFYPFFLAGMHFNRDMVTRLRNQTGRVLSLCAVAAVTAFFALSPVCHALSPKIFYGRYNYACLGQGILTGILTRCICYAVGFLMTLAVMILVSERKTFFSYLGTRTMAVYLFHGLTYSYLKDCTSLLQQIDTAAETALLLIFCVILTAVFSAPVFTSFTNRIADLPLTKPLAWRPDLSSFRIFLYGGRG